MKVVFWVAWLNALKHLFDKTNIFHKACLFFNQPLLDIESTALCVEAHIKSLMAK